MTIQTLPRTLVAGAIKVVRLPADLALAYSDGPFATSAGVAVDRVDAAVRGAAHVLPTTAAPRRGPPARARKSAPARCGCEPRPRSGPPSARSSRRRPSARPRAAARPRRKRAQAQAARSRRAQTCKGPERSAQRRKETARGGAETEEKIDDEAKDERAEVLGAVRALEGARRRYRR